jgi:hypothetical protein
VDNFLDKPISACHSSRVINTGGWRNADPVSGLCRRTKRNFMKVNFAEVRKRAESEGLLGAGSYLKLQEGDNRIRLMSECIEHPGEFNGKPTYKWLCYVLDRRDGKNKPFFMANTIYKLV